MRETGGGVEFLQQINQYALLAQVKYCAPCLSAGLGHAAVNSGLLAVNGYHFGDDLGLSQFPHNYATDHACTQNGDLHANPSLAWEKGQRSPDPSMLIKPYKVGGNQWERIRLRNRRVRSSGAEPKIC